MRIILCMAQREDKISPVKKAADVLGITCGYVNKAVIRLRQYGSLECVQRLSGGCPLSNAKFSGLFKTEKTG